jgi:hypothetical protein
MLRHLRIAVSAFFGFLTVALVIPFVRVFKQDRHKFKHLHFTQSPAKAPKNLIGAGYFNGGFPAD